MDVLVNLVFGFLWLLIGLVIVVISAYILAIIAKEVPLIRKLVVKYTYETSYKQSGERHNHSCHRDIIKTVVKYIQYFPDVVYRVYGQDVLIRDYIQHKRADQGNKAISNTGKNLINIPVPDAFKNPLHADKSSIAKKDDSTKRELYR
jgi:hypothetical protein